MSHGLAFAAGAALALAAFAGLAWYGLRQILDGLLP